MRDADHQPLPHTLLWRAGAKQQSNGRRQCGRSNVQSKGGAAHPKGHSIYGKPVAGMLEDMVDWCNRCTGCTGRCTGRCKNCTGRTGRITRGVFSFSNGTARTAHTIFTTARTAHTIDLSPPHAPSSSTYEIMMFCARALFHGSPARHHFVGGFPGAPLT